MLLILTGVAILAAAVSASSRMPAWAANAASALPRQDLGEVPHPRVLGDEPEEDARLGLPLGGEAPPVARSEVAPGDGEPRGGDVALDELGPAAHLDAAERARSLEDDESAAGIAGQVAELYVALGDHDLEGAVLEAEPHRRDERAPVLPVRRQHRRRRRLEERAHLLEPAVRQRRSGGRGPAAVKLPLEERDARPRARDDEHDPARSEPREAGPGGHEEEERGLDRQAREVERPAAHAAKAIRTAAPRGR